jgi:phage terminase Nu1 subunit (DNA packaging protein)
MARELGYAPSLISRYKGRGMPMESAGVARSWLHENVAMDVRTPRDNDLAAPDTRPPTDYHSARARRETAEAELAELKLAELQGQLVRADEWKAALAKRAAGFREGLLQIPARLAAQLAAETSEARVHALLDAELRQVLRQLTDGT